MERPLFSQQTQIAVRAVNLAERIDLSGFTAEERLSTSPLVVRAGNEGCAALFRYGVAVMFGLLPVEEAAFIADIKKLCKTSYSDPPEERVEVRFAPDEDERIEKGVIVLKSPTLERLQVVADCLSDSVVLEYYERMTEATFDRVEPLARSLEQGGRGSRGSRALLKHIGSVLLMEHRMVGRIEVGQKPDVLWERVELEPLYQRLATEYELRDRQQAVERRIQLVSRTVETVLDLLQQRRSLRVEWYIVILILVEIGLTLYEMFLRH
ncbi:MAG: RMD1 family protein [Candidatus Hydrogenedentes bacterium]|nr:RMD1 family protein [Candidatus Hydrogenedentota bacterium]